MDIQKLQEILSKEGTFVIAVSPNFGIDEMASALSLYLGLSASGKSVSVVSSKQPLVEVSNLVGIDKVKPSFESQTGDLIVSFPYKNDEIGKVSYTLEGGFLNIIVKPKDNALSFGEKDVLFRRSGGNPSVLITLGVKRLSDLASLFDLEGLKETMIINIDKAGGNEGFGNIAILGQGASSVSEQVANMLLSLGMPIDMDMAQNLMAGLVSATGNFQSPKTSSLAFEMAGVLMRSGAKREIARPVQQPRSAQPFGPSPRPTQPFGQRGNISQQIQQRRQNPGAQETPPDWLAPKIYKGSTNVE